MNSERKAKKRAILDLKTIDEYNNYMNNIKLSDEQRMIADMAFINGYDYRYIGDKLGYSERTIKAKMLKILSKL